MKNIVIGITGASGSIYGLRLVEELLRAQQQVSLLLTNAGRQVLAFETGLKLTEKPKECLHQLRVHFNAERELRHYALDDFFAPIASGSSAPDAVVIVALKERRQLLLVPRETPFNQLHLENLLRLSQAGAQILPAMPAFYQKPQSVADLVDFMVGKTLDSLGVEHQLFKRWGADS